MEIVKYLTTLYSSTLQYVWFFTIFIFINAVIALLLLSFIKIYLESKRAKIEELKKLFLEQLQSYIFLSTDIPKIKSKEEYLALANAIIETNNFITIENRKKIDFVIEQTGLGKYLLNNYNESFFWLKKRFFLTKMIYLEYYDYKDFFYHFILKQKRLDILEQVLYGYVLLINNSHDMLRLSNKVCKIYQKGADNKFCEFIFTNAIKNLSKETIVETINNINRNPILAKNLIVAIKNLHRIDLVDIAEKLYKQFQSSEVFIIHYIEMLAKFNIRNCDIIKQNYLNDDLEVKMACAKFGLKLCDNSIDFLYIYCFDSYVDVRKAFFESCIQYGVKKLMIYEIISKKPLLC